MKKTIIIAIFILLLVACGGSSSPEDTGATSNFSFEEASYDYLTFEEALLEFVTDIVIAQYVGHRPFGENLTEFEFVVSKRILGNVTDRIFIYARNNINAYVLGHESEVNYLPGDLTFIPDVDYLLPLIKINSPYITTYDGGDNFVFVRNMMIDLGNPSNSIMYSEALDTHVEGMNLNEDTSTLEIISFVEDIAQQIERPEEQIFIRSEIMEDIIKGSPYIWVIEINDPFRLSHEQSVTDWGLNDLYNGTIIQVLKGNAEVGYQFRMIFHADTVLLGERHIVATAPLIEGGGSFYSFTSRSSLFRIDQLEEIMLIIDSGH